MTSRRDSRMTAVQMTARPMEAEQMFALPIDDPTALLAMQFRNGDAMQFRDGEQKDYRD